MRGRGSGAELKAKRRNIGRVWLILAVMVGITCGGAHADPFESSVDNSAGVRKTSLDLSSSVKLDLSRHAVRPGGTIKSRVDNGSTTDLEYGRAQSLQRYEDGRWVKLPEKPVFQSLYVVQAGEVGRWQSLHIPKKAEHGRYRVRRMVAPIRPKQGKRHSLFGYFTVCRKCPSGN